MSHYYGMTSPDIPGFFHLTTHGFAAFFLDWRDAPPAVWDMLLEKRHADTISETILNHTYAFWRIRPQQDGSIAFLLSIYLRK